MSRGPPGWTVHGPAHYSHSRSGLLPLPSARYARNSRLVAYLSVAYLLLVAYASLHPFANWRAPNVEATRFLFAGWPAYIIG